MSYRSYFEKSGIVSVPQSVGQDIYHKLLEINEPGNNLAIMLWTEDDELKFHVVLDGVLLPCLWENFIRALDIHNHLTDARRNLFLAVYDAANDYYAIVIDMNLKWYKSLEISAHNISIVATRDASATVYYDRMRELPIEPPIEDVQRARVRPDPEM